MKAFYRGYVDNARRAAQVKLVHLARPDTDQLSGQTWCYLNAGAVTKSPPVVLDPIPPVLPGGLTWCGHCLGRYAAHLGRLDDVARLLSGGVR